MAKERTGMSKIRLRSVRAARVYSTYQAVVEKVAAGNGRKGSENCDGMCFGGFVRSVTEKWPSVLGNLIK